METLNRKMLISSARAITASLEIAEFCRASFGRALLTVVGAYAKRGDAAGIPDVDDSPFCWIYTDGENDELNSDASLVMRVVVGGVVLGENGEKVISKEECVRTETENGLIINGGDILVETLREKIKEALLVSDVGGSILSVKNFENDLSHFPLSWAELEVSFTSPVTFNR